MPSTSLERFIRTSDALVKFDVNFDLKREDSANLFVLEILDRELEQLWVRVGKSYEDCLDYIERSGKAKPEDIEVAESKYTSTMYTYAECSARIKRKMEELKPKVQPAAETRLQVNENFCHNMPLPPCDTDVFDGDYLSWPTFRDLFTALYVNNSRLSNVERLCYLVKKTGKEAREIVSKFPLTNDSFDIAWSLLRDTYENPRMLVNNQLKNLFGLATLTKETSAGLKILQRGINGFLAAMSIYKISTSNWDPIIVFICIQRLPEQTVSIWEQGVRDKSSLPLWKDLDCFLTERIQTLDCIRDLKGSNISRKEVDNKVRTHVSNTSSASTCILCPGQGHLLRFCHRFQKMSISERFSAIKRHHCCVNCLSRQHEVKDCRSSHSCSICNKRHHTLLHREVSANNSANTTIQDRNMSASQVAHPVNIDNSGPSTSRASNLNNNRQVFHLARDCSLLLGTSMVTILCPGITYPARALIDPASEASFISERLRNQLRLPSTSTSIRISGVDRNASVLSRKVCTLRIGSLIDDSVDLETSALVLPSISGNLPSFVLPSHISGKIPDLELADPNFYKSGPVDILLGADIYPNILLGGLKRNIFGSLLAQETVFGWILTGPVKNSFVNVHTTAITLSEEDNLNRNLLKFWELEEAPKRRILSPEDRICEQNYKSTTQRNSSGRYIVTLPFKPDFPRSINLGISRTSALRQFFRIESSLLRKPDIRDMYDEVVKEYLSLGHMKPVGPSDRAVTYSCYLPHHPVIKLDRKTTKLRVVFNASNKTSNGTSLNDCLFVGPTLQADLVILILRWRLFRYVFNCDITQMYRQIRVHPSHTPFQRILYRSSPDSQLTEYELQTVTFGVNCAPYLAIRTLLQLADDCQETLPLASDILRKGMYVDDVLTGAHDVSTALIARDQLVAALSSAGFELRKWTSNERSVLTGLPTAHLVDAKLLTFEESSNSKTLGILWNAQLDSFFFKVNPIEMKSSYTKREVLSTIAKLFDPVGWLSPVIVMAKIIMQRIWQDNIDWDECLPASTEREWVKFVECYEGMNEIKIPRWVNFSRESAAELHVFSDASEKAYAGVVYIRIRTPDGTIFTHLLSSRTRVAPLKSVSLPRLELCGAVLASETLGNLLREIDIPIERIYCWTDSTIVLAWLRKAPCTWTTFVANRVCLIHENTGGHNWHHVRSEDNPADLGSRGVSPLELAKSELWWHGPHWLRQEKILWNLKDLGSLNTDSEVRKVKVHVSFFDKFEDILERFSSLDRALRVISYIFRFFFAVNSKHRNRFRFDSTIITSSEVKMVKLRLAIVAQKAYFAEEYGCLSDKIPLPAKSSLVPLNPFLDEQGLMRLNGRLGKSPSLSYGERYPIILPYHCRFARLLAEFVHLISIHGGNQLMLRIYRFEYWVPRLRTLVRTIINGCKRCIIERKRTCSQIMAALPPERTTLDRPFTNTGVDFAGPFDVKTFTGRSCQITKGYVCIFVCFATKAIHLEAASDLSTDIFLAAFNRFISRRGCPHTIFSDNGTNFVGASNEISRDFTTFLKECQARMCPSLGYTNLNWKFIPAGAPHMGGLWEAGVKSFKLHFRKEAQSCRYTFEELSTVLARIEACLNSRPLCPMPDNPSEPVALTPGHFLIGSPILAPPEPSMLDSPVNIVNRYRKIRALVHHFCKRWKEEYLSSLHKRYKWQHPQRDVELKDLVVIRNEQLPATAWNLGIVEKIYSGSDGHVRVADIRTKNGIIKRPITKLVVLH